MNDNWYNGVVDMSFDTLPQCLLSKDEMQAWCDPKSNNYNTENCTLLNEIKCQAGTGSSCNDGNQFTFGPKPDGNIIQNTRIVDGNCVIQNPITGNDINIGPPDSSGKCTRNIFYCNGHGTCNNNGSCICDDGYTIEDSTGTNVCIKKDAPSTNFKCVFGSGMQAGKCGDSASDWYNDNNNCGPKNNTGYCDIKHFCKDGLTAKQTTQMCTYNKGSSQKTGCKSTNDGGTQSGLSGCNNTDNVCCWQNGSVVGCQNENDRTTDPPGTRRGVDKDGNEFLQYFTGQWNNRGVWPFQTTVCSYSPYPEQKLALGPS
jgi:hypothetical protein